MKHQTSATLIFVLMLTCVASGAWARSPSESCRALSTQIARDVLASSTSQVTGSSEVQREALERVIAEIDSLGLDQGDTATTLSWLISKGFTAKVSIVKEPELFAPLAEALGDEAELLANLKADLAEGDDWDLSLEYHPQGNEAGPADKTPMGFYQHYREVAIAVNNATMGVSVRNGLDCMSLLSQFAPVAPQVYGDVLKNTHAEPWEISAKIFLRRRTVLAGSDEHGVQAKITWGLDREQQRTNADEVGLANAFFAQGRELTVGEDITLQTRLRSAALAWLLSQGEDLLIREALENGIEDPELAEAVAVHSALAARGPDGARHRFAFELTWNETDEYDFSHEDAALLSLPEDESLVAKLSYSLQFPKTDFVETSPPLYEFSASYEDVDGDSMRQSRFVANAFVVMRVAALGKDTDLTFGLSYANKPKYLVLEDLDEQLTARLALKFKIGQRALNLD